MKAIKKIGVRLINELTKGFNWSIHKDIILDFWIFFKCRESGYAPKQFTNMYYVNELPIEAQEAYEAWFNEYDFNNSDDKDWIEFVSRSLNIFYQTSDPTLLPPDTWFVILLKSEVKALEIAETQIFHGNPNINTFWKIDTNSKAEEVAGRRNGYLFCNELENVSNMDTRGFYWAVAFQCAESVKLYYNDNGERKSRCICWASDAKNITLAKITTSGRFVVVPVEVEGKSWKPTKIVPDSKDIRKKAFTGHSLTAYLNRNYYDLFGKTEEIEASIKAEREVINQRKSATNTMNDEEVNIGELVNVRDFILDGNVDDVERERNKTIRKRMIEHNREQERAIKKKMRDATRNQGKVDRRARNSLNPLLSKK